MFIIIFLTSKVKIFSTEIFLGFKLVDSTTIKQFLLDLTTINVDFKYYQGGFKTKHKNIIRVNYNNKIGKNLQ